MTRKVQPISLEGTLPQQGRGGVRHAEDSRRREPDPGEVREGRRPPWSARCAHGPPARSVRAVPRFLKSKRRLPPSAQEAVDAQVNALLDNPLAGVPKVVALRGVRVVKFKAEDRQYLPAYVFYPRPTVIEMLDVGVHEISSFSFDRRLSALDRKTDLGRVAVG